MDPIADMITHIKNAGNAGRENVVVSYSNMKADIAKVLKEGGFIKNFEKKSKGSRHHLSLDLFVENRVPKIKGVKRISKTSKRIYKKHSEIRAVKNGYGMLVLSTPKGVMAGHEARKQKFGGEVLFSIW
jgi:small subunit ribosomal protein S8